MKKRCWPAAAVTAALTLLLFSLFELYPFAQQTLAWCDMKQQVIPFLLDFQNIVKGNADFLLNTQNAGGMSFLGVFFFFVSSPFTLLVWFVPAEEMFLFANVLVLLKMSFTAYTTAFFLRRQFHNFNTLQTTALSVMYAFGGYTMLYYQNVVWLDIMAMFPILCMGLKKLINEQKCLCFTVSLCAIMVLNFYLTYMVVVFLILAFGIFIFYKQTEQEKRKQSIVLLGLSALCSALITGVVWLPSFLQYLESARTVGMLESIASGSFITTYYTTLPILLCSAGVFSALVFLVKAHFWQDAPMKALFLVWALMVIPLFIEPINKMWHTGSYQAFPARYGYMTAFLGLLFLAKVVADLNARESQLKQQDLPGVAIGVFLFLTMGAAAYFLLYYRFRELTTYTRTLWADAESTLYFVLFTLVAALCYYLLLYLYQHQYLTKRVFSVFFLLLVCCESIFSGSVFIGSAANPESFYRPVFDLANRIDDQDLYRVKNNQKYFDVNLLGSLNYPTINHYTSLTNEDFMFTMKKLGYSSYWMEVSSHGGTEFSDALLGHRYTILKNREVSETDRLVYQNGIYSLIQNPELLSFGTVFQTEDIASLQHLPDLSRMELQQYLFTKLFGESEPLVVDYEYSSIQNLHYNYNGGKIELIRLNPEQDGILEYNILVEGTQTLYVDCFDNLSNRLTEDVYNTLHVSVNGQTVEYEYPVQRENGLLKLGTFTDETVKVRLQVREDLLAKSFGVFGLDYNLLVDGTRQAQKVQIYQQGNALTGTVSITGEQQYLLLSLPYQPGYTVQVNGREAEALRVFDDFTAIPLQQGKNTITLTFVPPGLTFGSILSVLGVISLVLFQRGRTKEKWKRWLHTLENPFYWAYCVMFALVLFGVYLFPVILYLIK